MTLKELSVEYRRSAKLLAERIKELNRRLEHIKDEAERSQLEYRIYMLKQMERTTRDIAVLTERYYDRGYRRSEHYTI